MSRLRRRRCHTKTRPTLVLSSAIADDKTSCALWVTSLFDVAQGSRHLFVDVQPFVFSLLLLCRRRGRPCRPRLDELLLRRLPFSFST